jgi:hypothetical protein
VAVKINLTFDHELLDSSFMAPIQVAGAVLRDSSGCDALADQVLSSLQTRQSEGVNEDALGGGERDEVCGSSVHACVGGVECGVCRSQSVLCTSICRLVVDKESPLPLAQTALLLTE